MRLKSTNVNLCNKYISVIYKSVNFLNIRGFKYIRGLIMNYKFDSIVNKNEAEALKEMIFKRAKERAKALTDDVHADVMDLARESFVSKGNPFSAATKTEASETPVAKSDKDEIGFPQKEKSASIQVRQQNKSIQENIIQSQVQNNMLEARAALSGRQSFMGALNFLNSQAAVSLIKSRTDRFEIVA